MISIWLVFRLDYQLFFICFFNCFLDNFIKLFYFISKLLIYIFKLINLQTIKWIVHKINNLLFLIFWSVVILFPNSVWTTIRISLWALIIINLFEIINLFVHCLLFLTLRRLWVLYLFLGFAYTLFAAWILTFLLTPLIFIFQLILTLALILNIHLILIYLTNHFYL